MKAVICFVCGKPISKPRVEALKVLGQPKDLWCCVGCSTVQKKKGIYFGEERTGELKIVDKLYNDSVRSILGDSEQESIETDS